ncbi:protein jag [Georgenia faecalis]|uniref:Jag family protein n=1 Tax=Georgenia faecalis TaxID=2483799 RepID=UPI000F096B86
MSEQETVVGTAETPDGETATEAPSRVKRLEEESEIAADYLEELLDIADLDGDIDLAIEHGRAAVEIVTEEGDGRWLRKLVGRDGEVLEALQELTRLAVQARTGERSRLMLDIVGYRKERRTELTSVAEAAVAEAQRTAGPVRLAAMNPFERKVVHDVVARAGLVSDSEGTEPDRHVVIRPAAAS